VAGKLALLLFCDQVDRLAAAQAAGTSAVCDYCPSWSDADVADGLQGQF